MLFIPERDEYKALRICNMRRAFLLGAFMNEEWKDIEGYEGFYQVSNCGNIKSLPRTAKSKGSGIREVKETIKKQSVSSCGYMLVGLHKDSEMKTASVHRLVALAFVPNPEGKPQVNHINGDKKDNRAENLEWVTSSENNLHKYNCLGIRPHNCKPVVRSDGMVFDSASEAARCMGGQTSKISLACNGYRPRAYGYGWTYIAD